MALTIMTNSKDLGLVVSQTQNSVSPVIMPDPKDLGVAVSQAQPNVAWGQ